MAELLTCTAQSADGPDLEIMRMPVDPVQLMSRLILNLVHLLVTAYEWIRSRVRWRREASLDQLMSMTKSLSKVPSSVSFICPSDQVTDDVVEKVIRLIRCCLVLGVKNVSVFDDEGRFQDLLPMIRAALLSPAANRCMHNYRNKSRSSGCIFDDNENDRQYSVSDDLIILESEFGHTCHVVLLSEQQARRHLVRVTQDFIKHQRESSVVEHGSGDRRQRTRCTITVRMMDKAVESEFPVPEPDLVIRLSEVSCLFGFCPWQVRLSEILPLPPCDPRNSTSLLTSLISVMQRFDKCEMRFGK